MHVTFVYFTLVFFGCECCEVQKEYVEELTKL